MITFICIDCGIEVTDIVAEFTPEPAICIECRVIREAPPEDREILRKVLHKDLHKDLHKKGD